MTIDQLTKAKVTIKAAMLLYIDYEDWHGVSDMANELRELEAQLKLLYEMQDKGGLDPFKVRKR